MQNSIYKCPVCNEGLNLIDPSYKCSKNHTYDISSEGYTNLLLANQKKSKSPRDNPEMVRSRQQFLNLGHYQFLSDKVSQFSIEYLKEIINFHELNILDAGCGEGYYTEHLLKKLTKSGFISNLWGVDISKYAAKLAAK